MLAYFFFKQSEYDRAEEYVKKTLALSEKIRDTETQSQSLQMMAFIRVEERKYQEAISYFLSVVEKCEKMCSSLRDNDKFKISFSDRKIHPYIDLSVLLCVTGNPIKTLYVSELSRARALLLHSCTKQHNHSVINRLSSVPLWLLLFLLPSFTNK